MAKIAEIISKFEEFAPLYLAEKWDNCGLLVGNAETEVDKVLVCLDVDEAVVNEAVKMGVGLIICHHPIMFKPINRIVVSDPECLAILGLIKNNISLYAAHTNLDVANGGMNDYICGLIGIKDTVPLEQIYENTLYKVAVYVPVGYEDDVRNAMAEAGMGEIGDYSNCTFMAKGKGTFLPRQGANPFLGKVGKLEIAEEIKIESIVTKDKLKNSVNAIKGAHPYEEVALDIIRLENQGQTEGIGRVGTLETELTLKVLAEMVKNAFKVEHIQVVGDFEANINKVAICSGGGGSLINSSIAKMADVYITGDVKYSSARDAKAMGLNLIILGHYESEIIVKDILICFMTKNFPLITVLSSEENKNVIQYI